MFTLCSRLCGGEFAVLLLIAAEKAADGQQDRENRRVCDGGKLQEQNHDSILEPAPHVPELDASGGQCAGHVAKHKANRKQEQGDQRCRAQLPLRLRRKLRHDRKTGQGSTAAALRQRVLVKPAI